MISTLKIGEDWWRVIECELQQEPDLCGLTDYENRTILIRKSLSNREKIYTLAHEITHAVFPDVNEEAVLRMEFALKSAKLLD